MTRFLALAVALLTADPATAHCFRYWAYPQPQKGCGVRHAPIARATAVDRWYVEIIPPPSWHFDWEREQAIERLKQELDSQ